MPVQQKIRPTGVRTFPLESNDSRLLMIIVGCVSVAIAALTYWFLHNLPDVSVAEDHVPAGTIQIFDRFDKLACTVEDGESRDKVTLREISKYVQMAVVAKEDRQFYEHGGVNPSSIARAAMANVKAGSVVQGGSTITQQLAKNLFFDTNERSISRKIKESFLALKLENTFSKDKILEMYLNQVYFGRHAYGIQRAASRYFNKSAADLNLSESAFLAGLIKAPSVLGDPQQLPEAIASQRRVLAAMVECGYITPAQGKAAAQQKLRLHKGVTTVQKYPYYVQYVLSLLPGQITDKDRAEGLRVYTEMDTVAQEAAERALAKGIATAPHGVSQGALAAISAKDGGVLALVGGVGDFYKNQFNRATNPHTIGSAFKPFVYLTAFNAGLIKPETIVQDEPITILQKTSPPYTPQNFDHKYRGPIPVREALALSRNTCAVRVAMMSGLGNVIKTAREAGLRAQLEPYPSIALGSAAASPLNLATAYSTFARGGSRITPMLIRRIERRDGPTLMTYSNKPHATKFKKSALAQLVSCLQTAVWYGTGKRARLPDRPVAGKTGTADAAKDIWFIGFTDDMTTAVWGGNDENRPIPGTHVTGGAVMAGIWKDFNSAYYKARPLGVSTGKSKGILALTALPLRVKELKEGDQQKAAPEERQWLVSPDASKKQPVEMVDPSQVKLPPEAKEAQPESRRQNAVVEYVQGEPVPAKPARTQKRPQGVDYDMPVRQAPPAEQVEPEPGIPDSIREPEYIPLHVPYENPIRPPKPNQSADRVPVEVAPAEVEFGE